jgi:hypothetical protein
LFGHLLSDFANLDGFAIVECDGTYHRKGGKTLEEARLRLARPAFEPRSNIYSLFTPYLGDERNEAWRSYLFLGRN